MRRRLIASALPVIACGLTACGSTVTVQPHAGGTVSASAAQVATTKAMPSSSPAASTLAVGQVLTAGQIAKLTEPAVKAAGSAHRTAKMSSASSSVRA